MPQNAFFEAVGFTNTKMEIKGLKQEWVKAAYTFYFQSKKNLYMAITYRGIQRPNDLMYENISRHKDESGTKSVIGLIEPTLILAEDYPLYIECMLDYMSKTSSEQGQAADGRKWSLVYSIKRHDIQNILLFPGHKEIERGRIDGSVKTK